MRPVVRTLPETLRHAVTRAVVLTGFLSAVVLAEHVGDAVHNGGADATTYWTTTTR